MERLCVCSSSCAASVMPSCCATATLWHWKVVQRGLVSTLVGYLVLILSAAATFVVLRADKEHPEQSDGVGWTYHHHPDIACWKGRLYVGWNSCQRDEDEDSPGLGVLDESDEDPPEPNEPA